MIKRGYRLISPPPIHLVALVRPGCTGTALSDVASTKAYVYAHRSVSRWA